MTNLRRIAVPMRPAAFALFFAVCGVARSGLAQPAAAGTGRAPNSIQGVVPTSTPLPTLTPTPTVPPTLTPPNTPTLTPTSNRVHDLILTGTAAPSPVASGALLTYDFVASNDGPSAVVGSEVVGTLPSSVSFVSCSAAGIGAVSCVATAQGFSADTGNIGFPGSASVHVVVMVVSASGTIQTTATFSSDGIDPDPANNTVTLTTTIQGGPTATPTPNGGLGAAGTSIPALAPVGRFALLLALFAAGWFVITRRA